MRMAVGIVVTSVRMVVVPLMAVRVVMRMVVRICLGNLELQGVLVRHAIDWKP